MKVNRRVSEGIWGVVAAVLLAASCGNSGGGSTGGDALGAPPLNNSRPWDGAPAAYVRVDVAVTAGVPRIVNASRVTAPPLPQSLGGNLLAVARSADGTALDAAAVPLAATSFSAGFDGDGNFIESDDTDATDSGSGAVFLRDDSTLDHIDLLDASGAVVATASLSEVREGPIASASSLVRRTSALTRDDLEADYPWLEVLVASDTDHLPEKTAEAITALVDPTDDQYELIDECLTTMSETSRKSVRTISMATFPNHGITTTAGGACAAVMANTLGGQIVLNADYADPAVISCLPSGTSIKRRFIKNCVHEAAHAFTFLVAGTFGAVNWEPEALQLAQQKIQDYQLSAGLDKLFATMQKTAVDETDSTKATNYYGPNGPRPASDEAAVRAGFASVYGAKDAWEDIAEYTAQIQAPDKPPGTQPALCDLFAQAGTLSELTAIQYAKALLVRNVGLVDGDPFANCTHGLGVDARPGISEQGSSFEFTSNLKFGYFDLDGSRMFGVSGDGPDSYSLLLRVRVDNEMPPLGLYRLEMLVDENIDSAENGLLLSNPNSFKVRTSISGLALISELTPTTTSGAIFFASLGSLGIDPTDEFPVITFRVTR